MTAQAGIKQAELDAVRARIEALRKATGTCDYKMDDGQFAANLPIKCSHTDFVSIGFVRII